MYRSEHRGLNRAIARVYLQNRDLARLAGDLRDYYVHGGERPAELEPLSRALRCESNGAHGLLEDVLTEAKRLGRGHVPGHAVEYWLFGRSGKLLDELRAIAKLLPSDLKAEVRRRHADRTARHLPTDLKKELERLYKDVAWSRRCHQWSFPTLYQYVVEKARAQQEKC